MSLRILTEAQCDALYTRLEEANEAASAVKDKWIDYPINEAEEIVIRFDNHESISSEHTYIHFGKLRLVRV